VTLPVAVPGLVLVLEDLDLGPRGRADDLDDHLRLGQGGAVRRHRAVFSHDEEGCQLDLALALEEFDVEDVALADLGLLTAGADDGVHG
jgi:hypothetical protein